MKICRRLSEAVTSEETTPSLQYAVKIVRTKDEEYRQVAMREFELLKEISHKNIVSMHDLFYNEAFETLYFVMDYIKGPTLMDFVI